MSDMVSLASWGLFWANHQDSDSMWWGSSREGATVAGSNHLYCGGGVIWVEADDLDMSVQHYDHTLFADFPNLW